MQKISQICRIGNNNSIGKVRDSLFDLVN